MAQDAADLVHHTELERLQREVARLRESLIASERDLAGLGQLEADYAELRALIDEALRERDAGRDLLRRAEADRDRAAADRDRAEADRDQWLARYGVVVGSLSWRLTSPLRRIGILVRGRRSESRDRQPA